MPTPEALRSGLRLALTFYLLTGLACAGAPRPETAAATPRPAAPLPSSPPATAPGGGQSPAVDLAKVALVGGHAITVDELRTEMARRGGSTPGAYGTAAQRRELVEELVRRRLIVESARAEGLDREPEHVATVERLLAQRYLERHLEPDLAKLAVTDEEIDRYYEAHREEFLTPARSRAAWILIEVPARATVDQRRELAARAEAARSAALALPASTGNFGALALDLSDDPATRYTGGEIGWIYPSDREHHRLGAAIVDAVLALAEPGQVSPVVAHERGFAIVKLVAHEPAAPTPIEKLRGGLRHRLLREKRAATTTEFHDRLLAGTEVWIDADALEAVAPLAPAAPAPPPGPPSLPPG